MHLEAKEEDEAEEEDEPEEEEEEEETEDERDGNILPRRCRTSAVENQSPSHRGSQTNIILSTHFFPLYLLGAIAKHGSVHTRDIPLTDLRGKKERRTRFKMPYTCVNK